jgi:hypothetical protein
MPSKKHKKIITAIWTIISIMVALSMVLFTLYPLL